MYSYKLYSYITLYTPLIHIHSCIHSHILYVQVMIANISCADSSYEETLNTLKYANRAKNIRTHIQRKLCYSYIQCMYMYTSVLYIY